LPGAHSVAYLIDMSRSLRAGRLALHLSRSFLQGFPKALSEQVPTHKARPEYQPRKSPAVLVLRKILHGEPSGFVLQGLGAGTSMAFLNLPLSFEIVPSLGGISLVTLQEKRLLRGVHSQRPFG
jgi:hypothetical protein